jgi:hypothetical protein
VEEGGQRAGGCCRRRGACCRRRRCRGRALCVFVFFDVGCCGWCERMRGLTVSVEIRGWWSWRQEGETRGGRTRARAGRARRRRWGSVPPAGAARPPGRRAWRSLAVLAPSTYRADRERVGWGRTIEREREGSGRSGRGGQGGSVLQKAIALGWLGARCVYREGWFDQSVCCCCCDGCVMRVGRAEMSTHIRREGPFTSSVKPLSSSPQGLRAHQPPNLNHTL